MIWNVPNILTILRLIAAPVMAIAFILLPRPFADWCALAMFVLASLTDYLDGYIARKFNQVSKMGTMMDPIADKAMVVIALTVLCAVSSLSAWILLPAALILFREVFVSGLREFLGDVAGTLKVTRLAKWKTAVQMVAIAVLLAQGLFEHYFGMWTWGMDSALIQEILSGTTEDPLGVGYVFRGMSWTSYGGLVLIWVAAFLTVVTGVDYFRKSTPHLRG